MRLVQEGPRNAKLMVVGEAPGEREDIIGLPFQGGSGWLMNKMFDKVGIRRWECFITNVVHVRPPANDFNWFFRKANLATYLSGVIQLKKDIEDIRPNLVLGLGAQALRVLTGKQGITEWRGSILESTLVPGVKTISTVHPAHILRAYDFRAVAEFDLTRAAEEASHPRIIYPTREHFLDPPQPEREALVQEMCNADWLSVDIECTTAPGVWKLLCVGFSDRASRSLVIPVRGEGDLHDIRRLCESDSKKIFQNGTFDVTILRRHGVEVRNFAYDTMLGHHALFPESASGQDEISRQQGKKRISAFQKGLAFQTSIYTKEPYYKADGKLWHMDGDLRTLWLYNGKDAAVTREIRDIQVRELKDFGTYHIMEHEMSLVEPLLHATERGLKIDMVKRSEFERDLNTQLRAAQEALNQSVGFEVNAKSSKQVADLFFKTLGIKPKKFSEKTNAPSADKAVIADIIASHDHPAIGYISLIREIRDLLERYIAAQIDPDGRMRCSFDITGTRTGRLSSRASIFGSGTNLQNQPHPIRAMFIPDRGKIFTSLDYSQAEARVVAFLANCQPLIDLFADPSRDIHKENASRIFNIPVEKVTYEQRYLAKKCVHATNYGMAARKFASIVNQDTKGTSITLNGKRLTPGTGISLDEPTASALIQKYFMLYPEIREVFWRNVENDLKQTMTLASPFGRKRQFFGRYDDKLLNEAYAFKPQSCIGDLCCMALVRVFHAFALHPEWEAELLVNVHDSLLAQCATEHLDAVVSCMRSCMDIEFEVGRHKVRIPVDAKVGYNWDEVGKDGSNPHGLKDYHGPAIA